MAMKMQLTLGTIPGGKDFGDPIREALAPLAPEVCYQVNSSLVLSPELLGIEDRKMYVKDRLPWTLERQFPDGIPPGSWAFFDYEPKVGIGLWDLWNGKGWPAAWADFIGECIAALRSMCPGVRWTLWGVPMGHSTPGMYREDFRHRTLQLEQVGLFRELDWLATCFYHRHQLVSEKPPPEHTTSIQDLAHRVSSGLDSVRRVEIRGGEPAGVERTIPQFAFRIYRKTSPYYMLFPSILAHSVALSACHALGVERVGFWESVNEEWRARTTAAEIPAFLDGLGKYFGYDPRDAAPAAPAAPTAPTAPEAGTPGGAG